MKYAWIVTANNAYLPSLDAMLNALEYYEYTGIDVHVIFDPDITAYLAKNWRSRSFDMYQVPIAGLVKPGHTCPHNYVYAKYKHAWDIRDDYDAIMHIDCDCLILDNFQKYFEVAAETGIIPCATFPHTSVTIDDYKTQPADWVNINTPLANFPVFYNPVVHAGVMKWIWDNQPNEELNSDPQRNNEMYFFNRALFEAGRISDILPLPGNLWVTDCFINQTGIKEQTWAGKAGLMNATQDRIQIIHNKFWKEGVSEAEIDRCGGSELCINNIRTILKMYDRFKTAKEE